VFQAFVWAETVGSNNNHGDGTNKKGSFAIYADGGETGDEWTLTPRKHSAGARTLPSLASMHKTDGSVATRNSFSVLYDDLGHQETQRPLKDVTNKQGQQDCSKCKRKICERCNKCTYHCKCQVPTKTPVPKRSAYSKACVTLSSHLLVENQYDSGQDVSGDEPTGDESSVSWDSCSIDFVPESECAADEETNKKDPFPIKNFNTLMEAFGISYNRYKNLPGVKTRCSTDVKQQLLDDKHGGRKITAMVNVLIDITKAAAEIILPGDSLFLLEQVFHRIGTKYGGDTDSKRVATMETMMKSLFSICENMPRHTKAFQTARAIVVTSGSQANLNKSFGSNNEPPRFGRTARRTAIADYKMIEAGSDPTRKKRSCLRIPQETLEDALMDIFSEKNVGIIAWGTKQVPIPGKFDRGRTFFFY
jgi:hypothetical protein